MSEPHTCFQLLTDDLSPGIFEGDARHQLDKQNERPGDAVPPPVVVFTTYDFFQMDCVHAQLSAPAINVHALHHSLGPAVTIRQST